MSWLGTWQKSLNDLNRRPNVALRAMRREPKRSSESGAVKFY